MMFLASPEDARQEIAASVRTRRLQMDLTQKGLSARSGVPLSTLRKFETTGQISLEGLLKLLQVVGGLQAVVTALQPEKQTYRSIDDVLADDPTKPTRKRGRRS